MLDDLKEEADRQQGGRAIQAVHADSEAHGGLEYRRRALVDVRGADKMAIVIQEILQDKIYLDATTGQIRSRNSAVSEVARRAMLTDVSDGSASD